MEHILSQGKALDNGQVFLDLSDIGLDDEGSRTLSEFVRANKTVTFIDLARNGMGDAACLELCDALRRNFYIQTIYLADNNIGDEGAAELVTMLLFNETITKLTVDGNSMAESWRSAINVLTEVNGSILRWQSTSSSLTKQLGEEIYDAVFNGLRCNKQAVVSHALLLHEKRLRHMAAQEVITLRTQRDSVSSHLYTPPSMQSVDSVDDMNVSRTRQSSIASDGTGSGRKRADPETRNLRMQLRHEKTERQRLETKLREAEVKLAARSKNTDDKISEAKKITSRQSMLTEQFKSRIASLERDITDLDATLAQEREKRIHCETLCKQFSAALTRMRQQAQQQIDNGIQEAAEQKRQLQLNLERARQKLQTLPDQSSSDNDRPPEADSVPMTPSEVFTDAAAPPRRSSASSGGRIRPAPHLLRTQEPPMAQAARIGSPQRRVHKPPSVIDVFSRQQSEPAPVRPLQQQMTAVAAPAQVASTPASSAKPARQQPAASVPPPERRRSVARPTPSEIFSAPKRSPVYERQVPLALLEAEQMLRSGPINYDSSSSATARSPASRAQRRMSKSMSPPLTPTSALDASRGGRFDIDFLEAEVRAWQDKIKQDPTLGPDQAPPHPVALATAAVRRPSMSTSTSGGAFSAAMAAVRSVSQQSPTRSVSQQSQSQQSQSQQPMMSPTRSTRSTTPFSVPQPIVASPISSELLHEQLVQRMRQLQAQYQELGLPLESPPMHQLIDEMN